MDGLLGAWGMGVNGLTYLCKYSIFQCNAGVAAFKMFQSLSTPPVKIMLMGGGCSTESEATAQTCHLFNVTQVILVVSIFLCSGHKP